VEIKRLDEKVATVNEEFEDKEIGKDFYKIEDVSLGFAVNTITGDDLGIFATGISFQEFPQAAKKKEYYYSSAKRRILARLDWEIDSGLFPERAVAQFQKTRDQLSNEECTRDNFMKFYNIWKENVLNFVQADPELSVANKLYQEFEIDYNKSGFVRMKRILEMRESECRNKANELKLDIGKAGVGLIINQIINDDVNVFYPGIMSPRKSLFLMGRRRILARLDWEESIESVPQELREKIVIAKKELNNFNWNSEGGFKKAYDYWRTNLLDWMMREHETNPEYVKAYNTYQIIFPQEKEKL
jgi:hypothetical protein